MAGYYFEPGFGFFIALPIIGGLCAAIFGSLKNSTLLNADRNPCFEQELKNSIVKLDRARG